MILPADADAELLQSNVGALRSLWQQTLQAACSVNVATSDAYKSHECSISGQAISPAQSRQCSPAEDAKHGCVVGLQATHALVHGQDVPPSGRCLGSLQGDAHIVSQPCPQIWQKFSRKCQRIHIPGSATQQAEETDNLQVYRCHACLAVISKRDMARAVLVFREAVQMSSILLRLHTASSQPEPTAGHQACRMQS